MVGRNEILTYLVSMCLKHEKSLKSGILSHCKKIMAVVKYFIVNGTEAEGKCEIFSKTFVIELHFSKQDSAP